MGNFLSATKIPRICTYTGGNIAPSHITKCFSENALVGTSFGNFFSHCLTISDCGHLLLVLRKISSLTRIECEVYVCSLAGEWCTVKMNILYKMLWAKAEIVYEAMLLSSSPFFLWQGRSYYPNCGSYWLFFRHLWAVCDTDKWDQITASLFSEPGRCPTGTGSSWSGCTDCTHSASDSLILNICFQRFWIPVSSHEEVKGNQQEAINFYLS